MAGEGALELVNAGISPSDLMDETRRQVERSGPAADHIVDWFLSEVASSTMPKTR
jgi:hypothetical protein